MMTSSGELDPLINPEEDTPARLCCICCEENPDCPPGCFNCLVGIAGVDTDFNKTKLRTHVYSVLLWNACVGVFVIAYDVHHFIQDGIYHPEKQTMDLIFSVLALISLPMMMMAYYAMSRRVVNLINGFICFTVVVSGFTLWYDVKVFKDDPGCSVVGMMMVTVQLYLAYMCWKFVTVLESKNERTRALDGTPRDGFDVMGQNLHEAAIDSINTTVRSPITMIIFVIMWVVTGAGVYKFANDWCWSNALYFSAQAGFSVGFGSLPEHTSVSHVYSIFHVLFGASAVVAVVSYFSTKAVKRQDTLREFLQAKRQLDIQVREGTMHEEDAEAELAAMKTPLGSVITACFMFSLWVVIGAVFAICTQDSWGPSRAFEYAVTALSTGGLQSLTTHSLNCSPHPQLHHYQAIFATFYIFTGIPIFGMTMGKLADILTDSQLDAERQVEEAELDKKEEEECDTEEHLVADELELLHEVQGLGLDALQPRKVSVVDHLRESQDVGQDLTFLEFLCLEAIEDSNIDIRYIKALKRKYSRLKRFGSVATVGLAANKFKKSISSPGAETTEKTTDDDNTKKEDESP